jgi:hypothetical protein
MNLEHIIKKLIERHSPKDALRDFEEYSKAHQITLDELYDIFAENISEGYLVGIYSWSEGNLLMNRWNEVLQLSHVVNANKPFPDYANKVYLAFDAGEYHREEDPKGLNPESRTRPLLEQISKKRK